MPPNPSMDLAMPGEETAAPPMADAPMQDDAQGTILLPPDAVPMDMPVKEGDKITFIVAGPRTEDGIPATMQPMAKDEEKPDWESDFRKEMSPRAEMSDDATDAT